MKGEKVRLRAPEPDDIELLLSWENDPQLWQLSDTTGPYSRYQIEQYVLSAAHDLYAARQLRLMIERIDVHPCQTVGAIDLFDFDPLHRRAGVGILISEHHRKEGLASETLRLIKEYAFNTLQLHQLYCHISTENEPSLKLFKAAGFIPCGTLKDWRLKENRWTDENILQCINPHFHD